MWSIIGHAGPLAALQRAIAGGSPSHAWLFVGPEGIGKGTVAREFAAALNCTSADPPCGECLPCRHTLAGQHADLDIVAPGGICDEPDHREHAESRDLRICQVRRLERVLSLSPYAGRRRVAIVEQADSLHAEAANAFLKTLEEPPAEAVIILLVERPERLPETVLSRCQRLNFAPLDRETILNTLIAHGASDDNATSIAAAAAGRLGWALQALEDPSLLGERASMLDNAARLAHAGRVERFAWAKGAESRAIDVRERYLRELQVWETWWRDVLLYQSGGITGAINADRALLLGEEAKLYTAAEIVPFLRSLLETREYLQENVDPQLALENLMLRLPQARVSAR